MIDLRGNNVKVDAIKHIFLFCLKHTSVFRCIVTILGISVITDVPFKCAVVSTEHSV